MMKKKTDKDFNSCRSSNSYQLSSHVKAHKISEKHKIDSSYLLEPIIDQISRIEKGLIGFTPAGLKSLLQKNYTI